MPSTRTRMSDFTGGEHSPILGESRVDLDKHYRGCRRLENYRILRPGATKRRAGSRWVAEEPGEVALVGWQFSRTDSYALAFTDLLLHFYRNGGRITVSGSPVAVVTPWTAAQAADLDYVQSGDSLFLVHKDVRPQRLDRLSNEIWRLRELTFDVPPSTEFGSRSSGTLTPAAATGTVTFTASVASFFPSDIGRDLIVIGGVNIGATARVTAFISNTQVTASITAAFTDTAPVAAGLWKISGSPNTSATVGAKDPVGVTTTITLGSEGFNGALLSDLTARFAIINDGVFEIIGYTSNSVATAIIRSEATATTAAPAGAWLLEETAFSALNGWPSSVTFQGDRMMLGVKRVAYGSKVGDYFNFATGALDDDGLVIPLNADQLTEIEWMRGGKKLQIGTTGLEFVVDPGESKVLTPDNSSPSVETSNGSAHIRPLGVKASTLFIPTSRRQLVEFAFSFEIDNYADPDLLILADHLTEPVRIGPTVVTRGLKRLAYQRPTDSIVWATRDDGALLGCTYLRDQNVVGWHRHLTGTVLEGPDGYHYPATDDGGIESIAVIPHPSGTRDQLWWAVRRTVGGVVKHYVEYLDDVGLYYEQLFTDSSLTYDGTGLGPLTPAATSGMGITFTSASGRFSPIDVGKELRSLTGLARATVVTYVDPMHVIADIEEPFPSTSPIAAGAWGLAAFVFTGLAHLEGKEVQILGDGAVYPPQTVTAGQVGIDSAAVRVEIGLGYTSILAPNRPEVDQLGTIQGIAVRVSKATIRVHQSSGGIINDTEMPIRKPSDLMGQAVPLESGDIQVENLDDESGRFIEIRQELPLPLTVVLATYELQIAEG